MGCGSLWYVIRTWSLFHHSLVLLFFVWASFFHRFFPKGSKMAISMFIFPYRQLRTPNREREREKLSASQWFPQMSWNGLSLGHLGKSTYPWPISVVKGVEYGGSPIGLQPSSGRLRVYQYPSWFCDIKEFTKAVISRYIRLKFKSVWMSTLTIKKSEQKIEQKDLPNSWFIVLLES